MSETTTPSASAPAPRVWAWDWPDPKTLNADEIRWWRHYWFDRGHRYPC